MKKTPVGENLIAGAKNSGNAIVLDRYEVAVIKEG